MEGYITRQSLPSHGSAQLQRTIRPILMLRHAVSRAANSIMTSTPKKVPIPKNGVDYRNKIVLAPMVRSGECPSRLLALKYGADLVWGPETIDKALIGTTRRENAKTGTIDFTRLSSNGAKNPALNPDQRESIIYRLHRSVKVASSFTRSVHQIRRPLYKRRNSSRRMLRA